MAILMLQTATSSIRVNRNKDISSADTERMLQTLNGVDIGNGKLKVKSLHSQLVSSIATIQTEISKLQLSYNGGRIMVSTRV